MGSNSGRFGQDSICIKICHAMLTKTAENNFKNDQHHALFIKAAKAFKTCVFSSLSGFSSFLA